MPRWPAPADDERLTAPPPVQWGVGDALVALLVAQVAAVLGGAAILISFGYRTAEQIDAAPLAVLFLVQIPLWLGYGGVTLWSSRTRGNGPVADFGWRFRWPDLPYGAILGALCQIVLVPLVYIPIFLIFGEQDVSEAARELTERATRPIDVVVLVLVVAVGAPVVEELFFRGLLLRSLERRFGTLVGVLGSSAVFGAVHFQLLQLPALIAFGLVAGWLTVRSGRLGPAIWAHVGFNLVTVVALLVAG